MSGKARIFHVRFTVRKYRPADFRTLWEIDQSCFQPGISYTVYELRTYIHRSGSFTLVAEAENPGPVATAPDHDPESHGILGFVVAERARKGGHIITIDVSAAARRQHVGSALLEVAEGFLWECKCNRVRLETAVDNVIALSFYKRHGYSVVKTVPRYYANGVDALLLEKNLLSPPRPDKLLQ
jgi:ribosomal-protein-alanine N-acetyltransferase